MFDVDKFIQCVQDNPGLWEKTNKEYMDKNAKERQWHCVGRLMYEKWEEMSEKERRKQGKQKNYLKYFILQLLCTNN